MQSKLIRFFSLLIVLMLAVTCCRWIIQPDGQSQGRGVLAQILYTAYLFTPAIAVLIVERWKLRQVLAEYHVTLRNINSRALIKYLLLTAVVLPALVVIFIYIFGNLFGIESFGTVMTQATGSYTVNGIELSDNGVIRFLTLAGFALVISLISGLTYNLLFAFGGEIAWRGFLERNLNLPHFVKYLAIGVAWGIWTLPIIMLSGKGAIDCIYAGGLSILFCIVQSFYLANALKASKTLFTPAAMQGIINSFMLAWLINSSSTTDYQLIGSSGLLMTVSVFILNLVFSRKIRA